MIEVETDDVSSVDSFTIEPDHPIIVPPRGSIEAENEATIVVKYLPGTPKKFRKKLLIQVSHYAPEEIIIHGEAGFPDIMLDLPRNQDSTYQNLLKEAQLIVMEKKVAEDPSLAALYQGISSSPELDLQVEVDRLAVKNFINRKEEVKKTNSTDFIPLKDKSTSIIYLNHVDQLMRTSLNLDSVENHENIVLMVNDDPITNMNTQSNFPFSQQSKIIETNKNISRKQKLPK